MANNCTPNIQAKLTDLYNQRRATPPTGIIDLAYSQANGAQVQAQMIQANGKDSQYSITYAAADCTTPVDCDDFTCGGAGTEAGTLTTCETFNSFDCKAMPAWMNLPIASLRDLGSMEVMEVFAARIWDQMHKIKTAISVEEITRQCAGAGCIATGTDTRLLKLTNALGAPNFSVDSDILADFGDAGFGGATPLLLGNREALKFRKAYQAAGLDQAGLNLDRMTNFPIFYDKNVVEANCAPETDGNGVLLAFLPGVYNLLSWSANAGMFASRNTPEMWDNIDPTRLIREGATFSHTVVQDPATGMLFDLNIVYEPKCQKWQYHMKTYYKGYNLPLAGCKDSCFNGIIKYDVCPDVAPIC